jgi:hemolysin activation/secretion protein
VKGIARFLPIVLAAAANIASLPAAAQEALRELVLRGNTVIAREELLEVARPWFGLPVNAADLEALRIALTRHYVDRGYVNSGARLDPLGPRDGVLAIDIVEGRLSAIRFSGLDGLDERYLRDKLWPRGERPLNLNELRERHQLLLDDPLLRRMNARLVPDAEAGSAALEVAVERAVPWYALLRLNNYRPASIGELSPGLEAGLHNLTGRGDLLRLNLQLDDHWGSVARGGLAWSVPVDYTGTMLSLQYDEGESWVVEEPLAAAGVKSRLTTRELGVSRLLTESLRRRAAIGLAFLARSNRTWIGGTTFPFVAGVPDGGLETKTLRFWQDYAHRSEADALALRSTFAANRNNLQPVSDEATSTVTARSYRFWLGQGQYARRVGESGMQAVARVTVQAASARMVALDGLAIGGAATVRGFRENQLIRDTGQIVNLELDIPVLRSGVADMTLNLVPFVDYGRGRNRGAAADAIGSAGLAMRWRSGRFAAELAWGKRLHATMGRARAGDTLQDHGVHFQLSYTLGRQGGGQAPSP